MMVRFVSASFLSILPTSMAMILNERPGPDGPVTELRLPEGDERPQFDLPAEDPDLFKYTEIKLELMPTSRALEREKQSGGLRNDPAVGGMQALEEHDHLKSNKGGIIRMTVKVKNEGYKAYATRWNDFARVFLPKLKSALGDTKVHPDNGDILAATYFEKSFPYTDTLGCAVSPEQRQLRTDSLQSWLQHVLYPRDWKTKIVALPTIFPYRFKLKDEQSDVINAKIRTTFEEFCESLPQVSLPPSDA